MHWTSVLTMLGVGILASCTQTMRAPDVSGNIRTMLDQGGLKKVTVSQDREKGVITLGGQVATDGDKAAAESMAKSVAGGLVVSAQIAVVPVGAESDAKAMNSDLDKGIEQNLDAALIQGKFHDHVQYAVKNHVVTLTGEVGSESRRREAENIAGSVPNVQQVVNELQVKHQRATSSE